MTRHAVANHIIFEKSILARGGVGTRAVSVRLYAIFELGNGVCSLLVIIKTSIEIYHFNERSFLKKIDLWNATLNLLCFILQGGQPT